IGGKNDVGDGQGVRCEVNLVVTKDHDEVHYCNFGLLWVGGCLDKIDGWGPMIDGSCEGDRGVVGEASVCGLR
ncbi:hypothetical protein KI387_004556, partial [Taxus chinensis]